MKTNYIRSIGFKIIFFYMLLALINISFIISIIFENQVELISNNSKLESEQQISILIGSLKQFSSEMKKGTLFTIDKDQKYINQFINLIQPYTNSFIIISENNTILHKSNKALVPPSEMAEDVLRTVTAKNFSGKDYYLRINDQRQIIYFYIPLADFQLGKNVLLVIKDISTLNESLKNLYRQAIYVIMVALFFHAVFALILFRYIIIPIRLLKKGAEKLADGDFTARIVLSHRKDEFGSLAESFNKMANSIADNVVTLSDRAERAIETRYKSEALTVLDELTGLFSRIYMLERINEEIKRTLMNKTSLALLIIDIDNFTDIIKIYGNNTRDIIVLEISKIVIRSCAETDVISRFSGGNFAILIADRPIEHIRDLSEKIRLEIENNTVITPDGKFSVTASFGVSFINSVPGGKPETGNTLMSSAEEALALAKKQGKNRVEIIS
jgi:diguanylate cyclase (GGDEF)-like protein